MWPENSYNHPLLAFMRHGGIVTIKIINMAIKNCVDDDRKLSEPARSTLCIFSKNVC